MDLHQKEIQGFFSFPVDNLRASPFLIQYIQEEVMLSCDPPTKPTRCFTDFVLVRSQTTETPSSLQSRPQPPKGESPPPRL